jgi:hypothetical protein
MAMTLDFGKCVQCNNSNSKLLQDCRQCGAALPWAKVPKPKISRAPATRSGAVAIKPSLQINWGLGAVGVFSFCVPIIGFFLYRSYTENGDEKATVALLGSILGILAIVARAAMRVATHS